jgi:hypothetical protein
MLPFCSNLDPVQRHDGSHVGRTTGNVVRLGDLGELFPNDGQSGSNSDQPLKTGVGVEKLPPEKIAKIKSRQDDLQTIFSGRLDIFYPQNLS